MYFHILVESNPKLLLKKKNGIFNSEDKDKLRYKGNWKQQ